MRNLIGPIKRVAQLSLLLSILNFNSNSAIAHKHKNDQNQQVNQQVNQQANQQPQPQPIQSQLGGPSSPGGEERILLMRHAEKPTDDDNPNLTPLGYQRAQRLAAFIPAQFGRPDFIFAAANSKKSMRPVETATPLAQSTGVPLDTTFRDKDYKELATALLNDPRFAGKLIVVVWHHGDIPELAHKLGAKEGTYPQQWPGAVYNQILQFAYTGKHHPVVNQLREPF